MLEVTDDRGLRQRSAREDGEEGSKGLILKLCLYSRHTFLTWRVLFRLLQSEEWWVGFITKFLVFLRKHRKTVVEKVDLSKSWETSQGRKSIGLLSICKHRALPQFVAGTLGNRTVCVTVTKDKALR